MARQCERCGKGTTFGRSISHAHNVTKRTFKANVQRTTVMVNGKPRRVRICTRCLRTLAKGAAY